MAGMTRGAAVPGFNMPQPNTPMPASAQQKQLWADADAQQRQANQAYDDGQAQLQRSRASDMAHMLMADPSNPRTTDGTNYQISNGGGGGSASGSAGGSRGGVAIGGGVYPDVSALTQQLQSIIGQNVQPPPRVGAPQVPSTEGAFAHAKDVSGRVGNKAVEALRNSMTQRGISDSGMATMGEANILGNIARQQADAQYQAANTDNTRQWESNQLGYQGDMGQNQMEYEGAIAQKNQSIQAILNLMRQFY